MNDIGIKQNELKCLQFQYAARYCFNRAEIYSYIIWGLCIINCISGIPVFSTLRPAILALLGLSSLFLQLYVYKLNTRAASFRMNVDYHLFHFPLQASYNEYSEDALFDLALSISNKHQKEASIQFSNTGEDEPKGVKDWYTINSNMNHIDAVFFCQKQNRFWDKKLSSIFLTILASFSAILLITLFLLAFNYNNVWSYFCGVLFPIFPILLKMISDLVSVVKYLRVSHTIDDLFEAFSSRLDTSSLIHVQSKIDKRRKTVFIVPNILHELQSRKMHIKQKMKLNG